MPFLSSFVACAVALFVAVEPLGVVPMFASLTRGRPRAEQLRIAARASIVGALALLAFAVGGPALLGFLGVRLDAFQVAGGLVLLLAAIEMVRGKPSCRCSAPEAAAGGSDIAVVPLAIPMLAGPGAMTATVGLVGYHGFVPVALAIVAVFAVTYVVLRGTATVQRLLGAGVLSVILRVLGLLLAALAIQSIVRGATSLLA